MTKKIYPLLILLLLFDIAHAQTEDQSPKSDVVKSESYIVKNDGTKIEAFGIQMSPAQIDYVDGKGKYYKVRQSEIKEVVLGSQYYILLPIDRKWDRLLKVIATNDKYVLSVYRFAAYQKDPTFYLYVHDKATKKIVGHKVNYNDWSTDYRDILKPIEEYFHECSDLIAKMKSNLAEQKEEKRFARGGPFEGINNISCSN